MKDELMNINGYKVARHDRNWTSRAGTNKTQKRGGLGIYIRDDLTFSTHVLTDLNTSTDDIEGQWVHGSIT